ncbi:FeoB-associated Cys-rich membrane protein [uncultured Desulfobulbus sp.]|uniref:FeoB-associated Cys-rich membrane protein n=1 Tax=uncultured Desulfobulbus sp. TaxID=239745 RepID=UPI00374CC8B6
MQQILVLIAVAVAVFFIARRIWKTLRNPKNLTCGCGCSGCGAADDCSEKATSLPTYKP